MQGLCRLDLAARYGSFLLCLPSGGFAPAFLHEYLLPLPLRFRCHCDLCLCLCADISIFCLDLGGLLRGILTCLLPSTLRSGLRLRNGRSGIFSLDSRRLLLCGIGSRSAALRRLFLRFLLPLPGEFLFCPTQAAGGGILNGVAAVLVCLPVLGRIPQLRPQPLRAVV